MMALRGGGRLDSVEDPKPGEGQAPGEAWRIDVRGMLREASRRVSLKGLAKGGREYVAVLSREKIERLIEQAVRTTAIKYALAKAEGISPEGTDLVTDARRDFDELLEQYREASRTREELERGRDALVGELEEMKKELERQKAIASGRLDEQADRALLVGLKEFESELDRVFRKALERRKVILASANDAEGMKALEAISGRLQGMIRNLVRAERSRFAGGGTEHEVLLLERRIGKLLEQLSAMENALRMLSRQKLFSNQQIANVLRELGLTPEDELFEKKKEMLKVVFEQNRELRKEIARRKGEATP